MEKKTKAETIAALVTDKYSGFKDGDEAILEAASDARLDEFRAASDERRVLASDKSKLETDLTNTKARLTVAEERIKASEQSMSEEEFTARAPESIKALIADHKAEQDAKKAALVSALKSCGADSEEELKKKSIPELQTLAKYARVQVIDYSGRGLPQQRNAEERQSYAPPDAYADGLKALRSKAN